MNTKEIDAKLAALEKRKEKLRHEDAYLLDDPGGGMKAQSDAEWAEINGQEAGLLRAKLDLVDPSPQEKLRQQGRAKLSLAERKALGV